MLAYVLLLLAMLSIQFGASFAKQIFPIAGAAGMALIRLGFATLILWSMIRPWRSPLMRSHLKLIFRYGLVLGLMNLSFYLALDRIPLGIAVTLEFVGPLAVAMLSSRSRLDFFWALLAGLGVYLILPQSQHANLDLWGIIFALVAGGFWGLYIIFGKKAGAEVPSQIAAAWGMLFAFVSVLPLGLFLDGAKVLNPDLLLSGFAVALFSSALPYSLEMFSLKKIPAKTFGILMSLEPAIASLAGFLVLSESLQLQQWLAIISIMLASLGTTLTHSR
jgi:inner membrane transporter RhtA